MAWRPLQRPPRAGRRGFSLVEMLVATAIGAMLLAAMSSVARLAVLSRAQTRDSHDAVEQARFALQRVTLAALAAAPVSLVAPPANTSGGWFSPVHFCVNAAAALIETTPADSACSGTRVIADQVLAFSASLPGGADALESASALVSVTTASGNATVTLTARLRLGGGTQ